MVVFSLTSIIPFLGLVSFGFMIIVVLVYGAMGFVWSFIGITQITKVTKLADKNTRGRAIGYYNSILGSGQILGAFISGFIVTSFGYTGDFLIASLMVGIGFVGSFVLNKSKINLNREPNSSKTEKISE